MEEDQTWDVPLLSSTHLDSFLPFGLALASFPPCTECYKRAIVGTSAQPCFVQYTDHRSGVTLAQILPRFARLLVGDTEVPE
jgi:hypothetical protein